MAFIYYRLKAGQLQYVGNITREGIQNFIADLDDLKHGLNVEGTKLDQTGRHCDNHSS